MMMAYRANILDECTAWSVETPQNRKIDLASSFQTCDIMICNLSLIPCFED